MNEFRTNIRLVSLNDQGLPNAEGPLSVGDLYLTPSRDDPEKYVKLVWAGDATGWQRIGSVEGSHDDEERAMRQQRVERVKQYFKQKREEALIERIWEQVPGYR
jgi:hypothetical protein